MSHTTYEENNARHSLLLILLTLNGKPVCYQPRNPNPVKDSIIAVLILNNVLECVRTLAAKLPSLNKRPASLKE